MSTRNQDTLDAIFANPVPSNIRWTDIESLFKHLKADISQGCGSRVRVALNGVKATFHRPHPKPTTDRGAVKSVRSFLFRAGVSPNE